MIVAARLKGRSEHALSIGWHAEAFARTKRLQPLDKILETEQRTPSKPADGAAKAASLFRRIQAKQKGGKDGSR